ncbi:sensor histidine kinase [Chitinophaga arvensicola]|uniref:Histidine kinase n=1 Tax=Chitinophaga arvensicola TaxID=29529 RepID=A0A1I0S8N8_9BACT|nr:histidine kinase [Chitinophaga arvensicola]SEW52269.1 Histidine kinase [Chitinophaga arvensicola]
MENRDDTFHIIKNSKTKQLVLLAVTFIGSYAVLFIVTPYSSWNKYFDVSIYRLIFDTFFNLLVSAVFIAFIFWVDRILNKKMPWTAHPLKRLVTQTVIQVFGVFFLLMALGLMYVLINGIPDGPPKVGENDIRQTWYIVIALILLILMVSAINTSDYLVSNWKKAALQAAEYKIRAAESKQLAAETELQALKLQIDPHFVFNNLSVLSELILKDQQLGYEYTENFAKVYKYLLINSKNKLITLREELKFLDAYLFLIKNRIGDGAIFRIRVDESTLHLQLPPTTLQLFVENALRHNSTQKEHPLAIDIYTTANDELVVSNILLPLHNKTSSTGIGLQNIIGRYALLSDRKPVIISENDCFTVKVPLIK